MIALAMEMIEEQLHLLQNVKILLNKGENKKSKENGEPKGEEATDEDLGEANPGSITLDPRKNKKKETEEPKVLAAPDGDMKVEVLQPTPSSNKVDNLLFWAFAHTHLLIPCLLLLHFKIPQIILKLYGSKN